MLVFQVWKKKKTSNFIGVNPKWNLNLSVHLQVKCFQCLKYTFQYVKNLLLWSGIHPLSISIVRKKPHGGHSLYRCRSHKRTIGLLNLQPNPILFPSVIWKLKVHSSTVRTLFFCYLFSRVKNVKEKVNLSKLWKLPWKV